MIELRPIPLLDIDKVDYRDNIVDVIGLFSKERLAVSFYNILATALNKQIELHNASKINFPFFVFNHEHETLNVEYNAFILGVASLFTENTKDKFLDRHNLSSENMRFKSHIQENILLISVLEHGLKLLSLNGSLLKMQSMKFYKPLVYKLENHESGEVIYAQMAGIFFFFKEIKKLLDAVEIDKNLVLDSLIFLSAKYDGIIEQVAFANKQCEDFWKKNNAKGIRKKVVFSL